MVNYVLRAYQELGIKLLRYELKKGNRRVWFWSQTGSGKGLVICHIANSLHQNNKKVLIVMRRREIIFQTLNNLEKYNNCIASILMSNEKGFDSINPIQVTSIDTLAHRLNNPKYAFVKKFEYIIIDECHDFTSNTYKRFSDFMGDKIYLGFSATPFRINSKPHTFWQSIVCPIRAHELRDQGFLAPARVYAPKTIDVSGIRKIAGEYSEKQLFVMVSDLKIIGDIVATYQKYGNYKPAILFAVNVAHSKLMAQAFNDAGIPAIHRDADNNKSERDSAILDLISGKIKVLCNCNIFSVGVDIPEAVVGILAAPTCSQVRYMQSVGRLLRTSPGKKEAIILDHANNSSRHGMPYDIREAELTKTQMGRHDRENRKNEIKTKICPKCFAVMSLSFDKCQYCGADLVKERKIKTQDGELIELSEFDQAKRTRYSIIKSELDKLTEAARIYGWKRNAVFFKLFGKFKYSMFEFENELKIPKWFNKMTDKLALNTPLGSIYEE